MLVMGFESSCDETGVALYDTAAKKLLSQTLFSQIDLHALYGGVGPELASRDHIRRIGGLTEECLRLAGKSIDDVGAVGYTAGPGLAGALLAAACFAQGIAFGKSLPAIRVHHLEGHLLSPLIDKPDLGFPFLALLVSGGHTQFFRVDGVGRYLLLGESVDDAAGEAFDKTAKALGLPYPGGKVLAQKALKGVPGRFAFPRPMVQSGDLNMSFSGLKTSALTLSSHWEAQGGARASDEEKERFVCDAALAFEDAIVDVLWRKARLAVKKTGLKNLIVAGGVSANKKLRERFQNLGGGAKAVFPDPMWSTDNAAMIAFAASFRVADGLPAGPFGVRPRWPLSSLSQPGAGAAAWRGANETASVGSGGAFAK